MDGNLIILVLASLFLASHGQQRNEEREFPMRRFLASRTSNEIFENQFNRGRCPARFYQVGDECIYFANDGKAHPWKRTENLCSRRIARLLDEPSAGNSEQPNMKPSRGVRQFVLNTPAKTEILRAFLRDYQEQNFAVRLLSDYNTLQRCQDGMDDKWPQFCSGYQPTNSTCLETSTDERNEICLREVDCNAKNLRLACEFTLPGSNELTESQFRNCPTVQRRRGLLPKWAWIAIIVGSVLLALIIFGIIFAFVRKSKTKPVTKKKTLPVPPSQPERNIRIPPRHDERSEDPLLTRVVRTNEPDTGYLQPRLAPTDDTANS